MRQLAEIATSEMFTKLLFLGRFLWFEVKFRCKNIRSVAFYIKNGSISVEIEFAPTEFDSVRQFINFVNIDQGLG